MVLSIGNDSQLMFMISKQYTDTKNGIKVFEAIEGQTGLHLLSRFNYVIGEQLYCMAQTNISSPLYNYDLSNYVLVNDKDGLVLSKIQQGKYYIVKDILISKEEKDSIQNIFQTLNFTSDTLYFDKNGQLLDKNQPMPQKKRIYYLPKDTNNLGAVEVWTYSLGYQMFGGIVPVTVVPFINGKVTSVKEYTSWP